jgi:hypothetical protein
LFYNRSSVVHSGARQIALAAESAQLLQLRALSLVILLDRANSRCNTESGFKLSKGMLMKKLVLTIVAAALLPAVPAMAAGAAATAATAAKTAATRAATNAARTAATRAAAPVVNTVTKAANAVARVTGAAATTPAATVPAATTPAWSRQQ